MKNVIGTIFKVVIAILILIGICSLFPDGCTQPDEARRVLTNAGYSNIEITGYKPFFGSDDDIFSTGFVATSPNGQRVSGAVTSGGFKGFTIRFE